MIDPIRLAVPTEFRTARLLLRPFCQDDAAVLHEAIAESINELRQFLWSVPWVGEEPTLEAAQIRCRQAEAAFLLRTDLAYLAFDAAGGRLVASIGLHRTDWKLPRTEVGYWVRTSERGKGYAAEGVMALTGWALKELGAVRIDLITDEGNTGSRAVAERCGFTLEGVLRNASRRPDGQLRHNCVYAKSSP